MQTSLRRSLPTAAALATTAALGIGAFTATANASPQPAASTAQHQYCATVLAPLQANQTTSRVTEHTCSTQNIAGTDLPATLSTSRARLPIMTIYTNTNYRGSQDLFVGNGPCTNGTYYKFNVPKGWKIHSWRAHSSCYHTTIYTGANRKGYHYTYKQGVWESARIGGRWSGHVGSFYTSRK